MSGAAQTDADLPSPGEEPLRVRAGTLYRFTFLAVGGGRLDDLVQHILDLEEHQRVSRDPNFRVRGQDQVDLPFQPEDPYLSVSWAAAHGSTPPR
ncbi:unnamed protein product [Arctogadus glacialis]